MCKWTKEINTKNYGAVNIDNNESDDDGDYLEAEANKKDKNGKNNIRNNLQNGNNINGNIDNDGYKISGLSDINFIFRGSKLVNTSYIYALVLFVGRETKLMLNRNQVPFKFSKFEKILNLCIGSIFRPVCRRLEGCF